jgi:hypothetical protein
MSIGVIVNTSFYTPHVKSMTEVYSLLHFFADNFALIYQ